MPIVVWLLLGCATLLLASLLLGSLFSFAGVWERMDNMSNFATRERIRLVQFGCVVLGKRTVVGGQQRFLGFAFGPALWLRRRDFGLAFLQNEGFPNGVAREVEGQVVAQYKLQLSQDHHFLEGVFVPFRIDFTAEPPAITAIKAQTPVPRKYRRIETIIDTKMAAATTDF